MFETILEPLEPALRRIHQWIFLPAPPNVDGDRHVEFSWIAARLPPSGGRALDFGCRWGYWAFGAALGGFEVTGIDLGPVEWLFTHKRLKLIQTDLFKLDWPPTSLDLIINCSSVEHVGLGRFGDPIGENDDLKAMKLLRSLLKPGGIMLLTIPVGKDAVFAPLHRLYGPERLPRLLEGFGVREEKYWLKDDANRNPAVTYMAWDVSF